MSGASRVHCSDVPGAAEILTPEFLDFLVGLDDALREHVFRVRAERVERIRRAVKDRIFPASLAHSEAAMASWRVPPPPKVLKLPGIEISGPASISSMMIQALNPGPEGERAVGYLDDDEDSGGQ